MKTFLRTSAWVACAATAFTFVSVPVAQAKHAPPQVTEDGLQLTKSTKTRLVYVKPGATFSQYERVAILDCYVEFEKDWQRDYNTSRSVCGEYANPASLQWALASGRRTGEAVAQALQR